MYLANSVLMDGMTVPPEMALYQNIFDLDNSNFPFSENITLGPINQTYPVHYPYHPMLHSTQLQFVCDSFKVSLQNKIIGLTQHWYF